MERQKSKKKDEKKLWYMHYKQAYMTTAVAPNVQAFCDYST